MRENRTPGSVRGALGNRRPYRDCENRIRMASIILSAKNKRSKYFIPLLLGALWNVFFGLIGLLNLPLHISLFYNSITPAAKLIANQTCWLIVLFAGLGYGIVAFNIYKYRFFITIGAIGKIAFFLLVSYLWLGSVTTDVAAIIAFGDFLWAIYFLFFIYRTREYGYL